MKRFDKAVNEFVGKIEASGSTLSAQYIDIAIEEVKDESLKIVPIKDGDLINSIKVERYSEDGSISGLVTYTADHFGYAHDNAGRGHDYNKPTTPGTHWHFLTDPAEKVFSNMQDTGKTKREIVNKVNKYRLTTLWAEARRLAAKFGGKASEYMPSLMRKKR